MRKYLLLLLLIISTVSYGQYQLTGSKIRYYNGLAASTRDTANWIVADTNVIVFGQDSSLYFRAKKTWNKVGTKVYIDSLYLLGYNYLHFYVGQQLTDYVKYADTAAMLSNYSKSGDVSLKLNISDTASMLSPYAMSASYVPYIGATTNVDLGAFNLYATNIGIGTTSAGAPLDIHSTGTIVAQFNNVASTSAFLTFQSNNAGKWRIGNYYNATANDFAIYDVVNSSYRVVLKNNGQLFFNNTNPISSTLTNRSAIWNTWDGLSGDGNAISNNVTYAGSGNATPSFTGYKANGTISAPTALLTGNAISAYNGFGYDGTDFYWGASIYHYAVSNWTSSSHESGVKIQLVPSGSVANPVTYHTFTTLGLSASGTITANSNGAAPLTGYGLLNIYPNSSYSPTLMSIAAGLYGGSMTITDGVTAASGTVSLVPTNQFQVSTYNATNTSVTYTNAATMYISGAPVAGTNVTITNPYSLYIYSGLARLNGGFATTSPSLFGGTSFSNTSSKLQINGAATGANTTTQGVHLLSAVNTYTDNSTAASGTATFVTANSFQGLIAAASNTGVTYTNAATVYIAAAPSAGTNATITNPWALYVAAGSTRLSTTSINVGSDATGDLLYRSSTGLLARLGIGSTGSFLTVSGGLPTWSSSTLTLGGNLTTSGAFATTLTTTGATSLTLPTSGTVLSANTPSALTAGATITLTPSPIATSFTLNVGANATSTLNMGTIPSSVVGSDIDVSITSTTTSCVITFGTSFKSQGTLTTGATSGKIFHIKFHVVSTSQVDEVSRTIAM